MYGRVQMSPPGKSRNLNTGLVQLTNACVCDNIVGLQVTEGENEKSKIHLYYINSLRFTRYIQFQAL